MAPAEYLVTTLELLRNGAAFHASGRVTTFPGFTQVYGLGGDKDEEQRLPTLQEGQTLQSSAVVSTQHFTTPPRRYSEASLVKALEEDGIGRPSTYASIISVLQARDYVNKVEGRFRPTILGRRLVDKLLHPAFDDILDVEYTARMEDQLDNIEKG